MGYRSNLAVWFPEETYAVLDEVIKKDLDSDWDAQDGNVWTADGWKWYSDYPEVKRFENMLKTIQKMGLTYDFIRIGEENDDVEIHTNEKFWVDRFIAW